MADLDVGFIQDTDSESLPEIGTGAESDYGDDNIFELEQLEFDLKSEDGTMVAMDANSDTLVFATTNGVVIRWTTEPSIVSLVLKICLLFLCAFVCAQKSNTNT